MLRRRQPHADHVLEETGTVLSETWRTQAGLINIYLMVVFTKDYLAKLFGTFENAFECFGDHSVIYVIPAYDFGVEISSGAKRTLAIVTYDNNVSSCL